MSKTASEKPRSGLRVSPLTGTVVILITVVFSVFFFVWTPTCKERYRPSRAIVCLGNLKTLSLFLHMYAVEHEGRYPPAERWCDVLVGEYGEHEDLNKVFRCPGDPKGPCSYAMNPNADLNGAGDVVLLFESKLGWNQFGGSELLTTENHKGQGCSVLFVDGSIQFVKAKEVDELKWGDGEIAEGELENVPGSSEGTR
ncbi:MAG: hypothetical protein RBR19_11480 [Sedimentisphaerales bacterium]|jgi:hypothetical protein|nr:hypothetical protein [Sedimentisphaerales bacterium]NLT77197.1 hypothetical protein [Planctomycetota bacterium]